MGRPGTCSASPGGGRETRGGAGGAVDGDPETLFLSPYAERRGARDCACLGWKGTCVSRALPAGGEVPRNPTNGYALIDDSSEHRSTIRVWLDVMEHTCTWYNALHCHGHAHPSPQPPSANCHLFFLPSHRNALPLPARLAPPSRYSLHWPIMPYPILTHNSYLYTRPSMLDQSINHSLAVSALPVPRLTDSSAA